MPSWVEYNIGVGGTGVGTTPTTQATEALTPGTNLLLLQVGSALYYVTSAQVGNFAFEANGHVWVQKSIDGGVTWTTTFNGSTKRNGTFVVFAIGTIIYIIGDDFTTSNIVVFRYDTTTDTFTSNGAASGVQFGTNFGISGSVLSSGKILVSYIDFTTVNWTAILYDTVADIWSSPVTVATLTININGQATDASDITYVFAGPNNVGTAELMCAPISSSLSVGTVVVAASVVQTTISPDFAYGTPAISGGNICFPIIDPTKGGSAYVMYVVRSTLGMSLSFGSLEVVDNTVTLPSSIWVLSGSSGPLQFCPALLNVSGTLYCFYSINTTKADDSTSQDYLVYRTSTTPGVWSSTIIVATESIPSSAGGIYPLLLTSGFISLIGIVWNPVTFSGSDPNGKLDALSVNYFTNGGSISPIISGTRTAPRYKRKQFSGGEESNTIPNNPTPSANQNLPYAYIDNLFAIVKKDN